MSKPDDRISWFEVALIEDFDGDVVGLHARK